MEGNALFECDSGNGKGVQVRIAFWRGLIWKARMGYNLKVFPHHPGFAHGVDYNPDQWIDRYPHILEEDLRLMDEAGCDTFSVGIFAWARYEPREGDYRLAWMGDDFYGDLIDGLRQRMGLRRVIEARLPSGVTAQMRNDHSQDYVFVQNFSTEQKRVELDDRSYSCMESGEAVQGAIELPPWSTRILRRGR